MATSSKAALDALAKSVGGKAQYDKGRVEYQVRGNGTKSTRYVRPGEEANLTPKAKEGRAEEASYTRRDGSVFTPNVTAPITSGDLGQSGSMKLPKPNQTSSTGTSALNNLASIATAGANQPSTTTTNTSSGTPSTGTDGFADQSFAAYLKTITAPQSTEALYKKTIKDVDLKDKQQAVSTYQGQLNAITAKAQADKLGLVGQGRGVTEAIIGGQQAQIDREAAIRALPVAAQLAAAQGDLEMAKSQVDTLFQIRSEDAKNKYNYQTKLAETVYNYADKKQQAALALKSKADDRAFTMMTNNLNYAQSLASKAIDNGQPSLAARIMALDPSSANYSANIAAAAKGIYVPQKSAGGGGGGGGGGTLEERRQSAVAALQGLISSGQPLKGGVPVLDVNQKITPVAWNTLIDAAPSQGLTREQFIANFGNKIYIETAKDGSSIIPSSYGISGAEKKLILGS